MNQNNRLKDDNIIVNVFPTVGEYLTKKKEKLCQKNIIFWKKESVNQITGYLLVESIEDCFYAWEFTITNYPGLKSVTMCLPWLVISKNFNTAKLVLKTSAQLLEVAFAYSVMTSATYQQLVDLAFSNAVQTEFNLKESLNHQEINRLLGWLKTQ